MENETDPLGDMKPMTELVTDISDSSGVAEFLKSTQGAVEKNFVKDEGIVPVALFVKRGMPGIIDLRYGMDSQETKDGVAGILKNLRRDCEAVIFISEVWMSLGCKKDPNKTMEETLETVTPPSQDPNRKEAVMLHLYVGKDSHGFINLIEREGGKARLSGWRAMPSTKAPGGCEGLGRFA